MISKLGNKCDREDLREVSYETGEAYAKGLGINFFETSAKTGHNVDHAFFGKFCNQVLYSVL